MAESSLREKAARGFLWGGLNNGLVQIIGALFGIAVVALQVWRGDMTVGLGEVLAYIGAPMTGGIVSYMIKSALEDKCKKNNNMEGFENGI